MRWRDFWEKHGKHKPFHSDSLSQRRLAVVSLIVRYPFYLLEEIIFGRTIANQEIKDGPIFIVGHWRSGTTHLHNLLSKDEQFSFLSFSNMVMPHDLLIGQYIPIIPWIMKMTLPKTRGIDNLPITPNLPQEEELAINMFCGVSYYNCYFFPDHWEEYFNESITFSDSPDQKNSEELIKTAYLKLVKKLTYLNNGKPLVFKNPASTSRISLLKEVFPNAKFIHVRRNPYTVFASSRARLPKMFDGFSWCDSHGVDFDAMTIKTYRELMAKYLEQRDAIPPEDLFEVSYEEIVEDPEKTLSEIYQQFQLDRTDANKSNQVEYIKSQNGYQKNNHRLNDSEIERIRREWAFIFKIWDYDLPKDHSC